MDTFTIVLGYYCNFSCDHCGTASGPYRKKRLKENEKKKITDFIRSYRPKQVQFTGGEPTFYIDDINELTYDFSKTKEAKIKITTNGWFASSKDSTCNLLNRINCLTGINLSWDMYHLSHLKQSRKHIMNLKEYCIDNDLTFDILITITAPIELIRIREMLSDLDLSISYQRIEACGRAKDNNLRYQYFKFETDILGASCPNSNIICYICGKGFSNCCGNLIYNNDFRFAYSSNVEQLLESNFYNNITNHTFGDLADIASLKMTGFDAHDSSACQICEKIHSRLAAKGVY